MRPAAGAARPGMGRRTFLTEFAAIAGLSALAGCATGKKPNSTGPGSYNSQDGSIEAIGISERSTTISVQGVSLEGAEMNSASFAGHVVVLNTWGSWCPPCNVEASDLEAVYQAQKVEGVRFLGIALREDAATSLAFQRKFHITYPSLRWDGGAALLQLKGQAPAPPTTLIVDRRGRLAARKLGKIDRITLNGLIKGVLAEE